MTRILLVEPNTIFTQMYKQALESSGYNVEVVQTAQAAISAADKKMPDGIILELQMADHNGIEFLYEFRSYPEWQSIPVIIHSFIPQTEFIDNTMAWEDLSLGEYLYKPRTTLDQLLKIVREQVPTLVRQKI